MRTLRGSAVLVLLIGIGAGCNPGTGTNHVYRTLESVAVAPTAVTLHVPESQTLTLTATYSDASTSAVLSATWTSSTPDVATVSQGRVTAVAAGTAVITATFQGKTATSAITVSSATLDTIDVTPLTPSVAAGLEQQFSALGTYTDTSQVDITSRVTWASATPAVATISNVAGKNGLAKALTVGTTDVSATLGIVSTSTTLTVTAALVTAVRVSPVSASIISGETAGFSASATFTDGSSHDVTAEVTWDSSDLDVAVIAYAAGATATATGVGQGTAAISATLDLQTGTASLEVASSTPSAVEVAPTLPAIASGTSLQLSATAIYSDHSTRDVTADAAWDSQTPGVGTTAAGGLLSTTTSGSTVVSATFKGATGSTTVTVSSATLSALEVSPAVATLAGGTTLPLTATGVFDDGSRQDLTSQVSWSSPTPGIATVSSAAGSWGLVSAVAAGGVTIDASLGGITGSAALTVSTATLSAIEVTPSIPRLPRGANLQLAATGYFSDHSTQDLTTLVTWSSSHETVATVSTAAGSAGLTRAIASGTAGITATLVAVSGTTTVTVASAALSSLQITPARPTLARGTTLHLVATGVYSDGSVEDLTDQVTWSSTPGSVAAVSNAAGSHGLATATALGSTLVTATLRAVTGTISLAVTQPSLDAIEVTPLSPTLAKGTATQLQATGLYSDGSSQDLTDEVTWISSSTGVATVSNAADSGGLALAVNTGPTTISAELDGVSGTTSLTVTAAVLGLVQVTPPAPTLPRGTAVQLIATGIYSDDTAQDVTALATWTSSNETAAAVSGATGSRGLVQSDHAGTTTISAALAGVTGSTVVTVADVTLSTLQVSPALAIMARGTTRSFTVSGLYTDGSVEDLTTQVSWTTSSSTVAAPSSAAGSSGLVTGLAAGTTTLTATLGSIRGTASLQVTAAVLSSLQVSPAASSVAKGSVVPFTATGIYSDGSSQDLTRQVTWTSSNYTMAVVSNAAGADGVVTATGAGTATITATLGNRTISTTLTVTAEILASLDVMPVDPSLPRGLSVPFQAVGTFGDTTQNLTSQVTWTSTSPTTAAVSSAVGTQGLLAALATGTANITATRGGISDTSAVTVTPVSLTSIAITPANPSLAMTSTVQLTATGTFGDGSKRDVTALVVWRSASPGTASVSNATDRRGLVTGLAANSAAVTATFSGVSSTTQVTVTSATLASIAVTPASLTVPVGYAGRFRATGTYSDGTTQDLTSQVTWTSSAVAIASISNAAGAQGLATAIGTGVSSVSATLSGKVGPATLQASSASLSSISVTPTSAVFSVGQTQQLTATGNFSDSSTLDLTTQVSWKSSVKATAMVSLSGLVTGNAHGSCTVTATRGARSDTSSVTVQ